VFVNRYYAPDVSATSQMLTDLAEALARNGLEVIVVSSRQLYEDSHADLPPRESLKGVRVLRIFTTRCGRARLVGRTLDYVSFYIAATAMLLRVVRSTDILVVKTDPPLLSLLGALVRFCKRARLVNWLQDVFPEVASRLSLSPLPRPLEALLCRARDGSLRAAEANVVLGTRMRDYLASRGIAPGRILISENWADEQALYPMPVTDSVLRQRLGLADRFVVAYSGNLGRAHDSETLLQAALLLQPQPQVVFLMIGGGARMRVLQEQARRRGLDNLLFVPYQPRDTLNDSLAAGDVHLVSLLPQLEGLIVPSKVYGILAAGRPVVFVGDPDGEVSRLVCAAGAGMGIAIGDGHGLCAALLRLRRQQDERKAMGQAARKLFESRYTLSSAVGRWQGLIAELEVLRCCAASKDAPS
jgi:glycosyltransferase involved in cell wall biosynthesis